jgi:hypothetical protein
LEEIIVCIAEKRFSYVDAIGRLWEPYLIAEPPDARTPVENLEMGT